MLQPNLIDVTVGANLRRLRKRAQLSSEELAASAGITAGALDGGEIGAVRLRASEVFALAQALGTTPGRFYEGLAPVSLRYASQWTSAAMTVSASS